MERHPSLFAALLLAAGTASAQGQAGQPQGDLPPPSDKAATDQASGQAASHYAGGGMAVQSVTGHQDGFAVVGKAGTYFNGGREGFGAEVELSRSLVEPESNGGSRFGGGGSDVALTTLGGYGAFTVRHPQQPIAVRARLGLAWEYAEPANGDNESELNVSYGLGGTAELAIGATVFIDYTHIEADVDHLNLGIQTRF
jgi:hypothetical protein